MRISLITKMLLLATTLGFQNISAKNTIIFENDQPQSVIISEGSISDLEILYLFRNYIFKKISEYETQDRKIVLNCAYICTQDKKTLYVTASTLSSSLDLNNFLISELDNHLILMTKSFSDAFTTDSKPSEFIIPDDISRPSIIIASFIFSKPNADDLPYHFALDDYIVHSNI